MSLSGVRRHVVVLSYRIPESETRRSSGEKVGIPIWMPLIHTFTEPRQHLIIDNAHEKDKAATPTRKCSSILNTPSTIRRSTWNRLITSLNSHEMHITSPAAPTPPSRHSH